MAVATSAGAHASNRGERGGGLAAGPTLLRAVRLATHHPGTLAAYLAATVATAAAALAQPLFLKAIIDVALPQHDGGLLDLLLLGMLGFIGVAAVASAMQAFLANALAQHIMFDLRCRMYGQLTGMSLRWFTANPSGDLLSRLNNDVGSIQGMIPATLGAAVSSGVAVASTLVVMVLLDHRLALLALAFVPLFIVPASRVGHTQRRITAEAQQELAVMNTHLAQTLSVNGSLLMRAFGRREDEVRTFRDAAGRIRDLGIRHVLVGRRFAAAMNLMGAVAPAVVFWYGGHGIIEGTATLGTAVAQATLLGRLFGPIASLLTVQVTVVDSLAVFDRIFRCLDQGQDLPDAPDARPLAAARGEVVFNHVSFAYEPGKPVLQDVSFRAAAGSFTALVGPSGAGKTTIAYLLARLYDADEGVVTIDGRDVRGVTAASLAASIGLVSQQPYLFQATVRQNLQYARPDATPGELEAAARAANIHEAIMAMPQGYNTLVGEQGHRLSGGELQRLAIARALLKDPAILILDEATSSVDATTERSIQQAMGRVVQGRTVLAIAHRLSTVQAADQILVVQAGRIVEAGRHADLLAAHGAYARLHADQFARPPVGD